MDLEFQRMSDCVASNLTGQEVRRISGGMSGRSNCRNRREITCKLGSTFEKSHSRGSSTPWPEWLLLREIHTMLRKIPCRHDAKVRDGLDKRTEQHLASHLSELYTTFESDPASSASTSLWKQTRYDINGLHLAFCLHSLALIVACCT